MALYKSIPGYDGLYLASNMGFIVSLNQKQSELKPLDNGRGYKIVYLYKNGKRQMFRIHRIIAKLFVPNPNNYNEVNHINGIKSDNRASQLEWCSRQQNIVHSWQMNLSKPICGKDHHGAISVFRKSTNKIYGTITEASKDTGLSFKQIKNRIKNNNDFITIKN